MINSDFWNLYEKSKSIDSVIRLTGTPNSSNSDENFRIEESEIISANSVETFTLEEFRTLIIESKIRNIDFILARVTTEDPNDPTILYNFYYTASEINRILYRSDSERHLHHRMIIRNPLNNMDILGQIYYYKISVEQIDKSIKYYHLNEYSDVFRKENLYKETDIASREDDLIKDRIPMNDIGSREGDSTEKIIYDAHYFASEYDFMTRNDVREYFKRNRFDINDKFLFELEYQQSNIFGFHDYAHDEDSIDGFTWRRFFIAYVSLLIIIIGICALFNDKLVINIYIFPVLVFLIIPFIILLFFSFIGSIFCSFFLLKNLYEIVSV
jgi:hypothetical protein